VRRRDVITLLGGAATAVLSVAAASGLAAKLPLVVFVAVGFDADRSAFDDIRDQLRQLGQIEGDSYALDIRASDDLSRIPELAREIVRSAPDLVLSINTRIVPALQSLTTRIPIVVAFTGDPVALGFTANRTRPTGNVTGIEDFQDALIGKRLELAKALVPAARRVGLLHERGNIGHGLVLASAQKAAPGLGLEVIALGAQSGDEIARLLDQLADRPADALLVVSSPLILSKRDQIIRAELSLNLPAIHDLAFEVHDGALAAYSSDPALNFERAAQYIDRLLHGARIAELPFDQPTHVALALNLKTARTIGLAIPPDVLARADEVVE
jgi:putative ABC transport system substrate-binding protein